MNIASNSPMLYYLHPDVSFFKGNGFTALGPYLDMPDNSSAGNVSNFYCPFRAQLFTTWMRIGVTAMRFARGLLYVKPC